MPGPDPALLSINTATVRQQWGLGEIIAGLVRHNIRGISPWRVWHYGMGWYEKMQTGKTADRDIAGWSLYRVDDDRLTQIALPRRCEPVTRVPGL